MTIKTPETMMGSEGKPDYFVVARKGNVWLGIKPFCGAVPNVGPAAGCKLRSAWAPAQDGEVPGTSKSSLADSLMVAWPELPFDRVDETRASATWALRLLKDSFPAAREEILDREMAAKFAARVLEVIGAHAEVLYAPAALAELIGEAWFGALDAMTGEGSDIIPLPPALVESNQLKEVSKEEGHQPEDREGGADTLGGLGEDGRDRTAQCHAAYPSALAEGRLAAGAPRAGTSLLQARRHPRVHRKTPRRACLVIEQRGCARACLSDPPRTHPPASTKEISPSLFVFARSCPAVSEE